MRRKFFERVAGLVLASVLAFASLGAAGETVEASVPEKLTAAEAASGLSKKEISYYRNVITSKQYVEDTEHSISDEGEGEFLLYDLNNDGRQELIVTGALGLRCASFSIVYYYDGSKFGNSGVIEGSPAKISQKGILFVYDDYEQAGLIRFQNRTVMKLTKKFNMAELTQYSEKITYDEKTNDGHYDYKNYTYKGKKITKKLYSSYVKGYQLKKVTLYNGSSENAKAYIK